MQLFQQSNDVHATAMLKQIGDDVKHKQDQSFWHCDLNAFFTV